MTVKPKQHYGDQFTYSREQIEDLLPGLWDVDYAYGTRTSEGEPEPGMPKAQRHDPRVSSDWIAEMCDMQIAWANCRAITSGERAVIFMSFGLGWKQEDIAGTQRVTRQAVSARIDKGIQALIAYLDGEEQGQ